MGKKSRRQRGKGLSHSEGNKVINPTADWRNHQQECYKHQLAQLDNEIDREWERQGV